MTIDTWLSDELSSKRHWNEVYATKALRHGELVPAARRHVVALMIAEFWVPAKDDAIIDIGGGASVLVDHVLDAGLSDVTVLDISERALLASKERLGARAARRALDRGRCARLEVRRAPITSGTTARCSTS